MRSILLYLAMVGLPLLGLLAILEAGERIVPPRSIGGAWRLEEPLDPAALPCGETGRAGGTAELRVSQSGPRAEVGLGHPLPRVIPVTLRGDTLAGAAAFPPHARCSAAGVVFRARLEPDRDRMRGTLSWTGCAACPSVGFVAERPAAPREP